MPFNLSEIVDIVIKDGASDLHLSPGMPPIFRVKKKLVTREGLKPLVIDDIEYVLSQILTEDQRRIYDINKELFLSVNFGNNVRFRITVFNTKGGYPAIAFRSIPYQSPDLDKLGLPPIIKKCIDLKQGLVLVTGPTGQGKTTTIASIIEKINQTRNDHIVTIEDPIEFMHDSKKSFIQQLEVGVDTLSFTSSLKSITRMDPNIIMVGEINDQESMQTVLNLAETGHLVFSTLHTNSAAQTIDRMISIFPEALQNQVRSQIAMALEMVISQRLVEGIDGELYPAVEVMSMTPAIQNLVRENKIYGVDNIIATSANLGMVSLDSSLSDLVKSSKVSLDNAVRYSLNPENLMRIVKK